MSDSKIKVMSRGSDLDVFAIADSYIANYHQHLAEANIIFAWRYGWKPNKDGQVKLGTCQLADDLDNELARGGADFVIMLNAERWGALTQRQREALVDHELMHAAATYDKNGDIRSWRIRGHDLEEFHDIVRRHGLWRQTLEDFVDALAGKLQPSLFDVVEGEYPNERVQQLIDSGRLIVTHDDSLSQTNGGGDGQAKEA